MNEEGNKNGEVIEIEEGKDKRVVERKNEITYANSTGIISNYFDFQIIFSQKTMDTSTNVLYEKEMARIAISPQQAEYLLSILHEHVEQYNINYSENEEKDDSENILESDEVASDKDGLPN